VMLFANQVKTIVLIAVIRASVPKLSIFDTLKEIGAASKSSAVFIYYVFDV